jgi:hypothetical protein
MRFFPLLPHFSCELHGLAGLKHISRRADPATDRDLERAIAESQLSRFQAAILQKDL